MDFALNAEHELIRNSAREFSVRYLEPIAVQLDAESLHPADVFKKLGESGWMGVPIPSQYGGGGADYLSLALLVEELSRSCASTGFTVSIHTGIVCTLLNMFADEEQKDRFLTPLASGTQLGAFCLTEPGAGTDVTAASTTAARDGDDYILNGTKTFTSNGPTGGTYLVFAWTDKEAGRKGMSAFAIPRDTPGLSIGRHFEKMGLRSSQTSEVILSDCRVPKTNLIGGEGKGLPMAMGGLDHGRIGIAAQSVGILQAALDESIAYSKERVQFGQPISRQQAIAWMLADMATDLEAARFLTYRAAWLKDQGQAFSKETAMAKLFASEAAMRHTTKAVQIHGGYGYMKGMKVERLMRDAKITEIYEGTSEAQRMVISGNLLR